MPTFRFRDKTTGLFYKDAKVDYSGGYLGWADRKRKFEYAQPRKGKKPTKAELGKEFVDMGKAKVHLLYLTGLMRPTESYEKIEQELTECRNRLRNSGVDNIWQHPEYQAVHRKIDIYQAANPGYFNLPEYLDNSHPTEIPETWELVSINTETFEQTPVEFDVQGYIEQQKKFRMLVDRFGQSVKDVYKKVEKKGVDVFSEFLVIGPDLQRLDEETLWNLMEDPEPDTANIDDALERLKECEITKKDYIRGTAGSTVTLAFKDISSLIHFRLAYGGKYQTHHINIKTMTEVIS